MQKFILTAVLLVSLFSLLTDQSHANQDTSIKKLNDKDEEFYQERSEDKAPLASSSSLINP